MQTVRNVAIIAVLALGVAFIPGGGTAAETALAALTMGFLAAMAFFVYRLYRENQLTLYTLADARRAILYGAFGVIALMIAGADELLDSGGGTVVWIGLIALSAFAIFRVWTDATSYG
jgi:hypothetical protein